MLFPIVFVGFSGSGEEIRGAAVVLAVGHSARSMYSTLLRRDVAIVAKPFAMGFRVEHPQTLIDEIQYGSELASGALVGHTKN